MKTAFFDVDTQLDFLYPAGALYVRGAERIVPTVARLNHAAAARGVPVISTTDAHGEDDPEFKDWPPHCVVGTTGQHKPAVTLLEKRVIVPNSTARVTLDGAQQIILEKQTLNAFATQSLSWVLEELGAEQFVVYGVVTEVCVSFAARGLLAAGKKVFVVADAIRELNAADGQKTLDEIRSLGGEITTSDRWV